MPIVKKDSEITSPGIILIVGPPGSGKSALAFALMECVRERYRKKTLYGDVENAWIGAPDRVRKGGYIERFAFQVPVEKKGKKGEVKVEVSDPIDDAKEFAEELLRSEYGLGVVDTFTTLAGKMMGSVVEKDLTSGNKGTPRVHVKTRKGVEINHATQQDYGVFNSVVESFMGDLWPAVEAGKLVVLLGHQKRFDDVDEETGAVYDAIGTIDAPGRLVPLSLPKFAVLFIRVVKKRKKGGVKGKGEDSRRRLVEYVILPEGDGVWYGKDRLGVLDPRGEVWTVNREEFEEGPGGSEEFFETILDTGKEVWNDWLDEFDRKVMRVKVEGKKKVKKGERT